MSQVIPAVAGTVAVYMPGWVPVGEDDNHVWALERRPVVGWLMQKDQTAVALVDAGNGFAVPFTSFADTERFLRISTPSAIGVFDA